MRTLAILALRDYDKTKMGAFDSLEKHHRAFINVRSVIVAALAFLVAACASARSHATPVPSPAPSPATSGYRIVSPATRSDVTMSQMLGRLSRADVVFFGEQHDDPETHRAEAETLDAIGRLGRPVVLSLGNRGQSALLRVSRSLRGRPILAGPARRPSCASMLARNVSGPSACWRCSCKRMA